MIISPSKVVLPRNGPGEADIGIEMMKGAPVMLKKYFVMFLMIIFMASCATTSINPINKSTNTNQISLNTDVIEAEETNQQPGRIMTAEEIKTGVWWVIEAASWITLGVIGHNLFWH